MSAVIKVIALLIAIALIGSSVFYPALFSYEESQTVTKTLQGNDDKNNLAINISDEGEIVWVSGGSFLGDLISGDIAKFKINIAYDYSSDLVDIKIKTSCGCTNAIFEQDKINQGESGVLNFEIDTSGKSGKSYVWILIDGQYDKDGSRKIFRLPLELNVISSI